MLNTKIPNWAKENIVDKYGNVVCKVCNLTQSSSFKKCIGCCKHDTLEFTDKWCGDDYSGHWGIEGVCVDCGKDFDLDIETIKDNYKMVKIIK